MQEIHNGDTGEISLVIYNKGVEVNADGPVLVSLFGADDGANTLLIPTASATNEPELGLYDLWVGPPVTSLNAVIRADWTYYINSASTTNSTFFQVVTPYATVSDVVDYYGFGTKSSDPGYKSQIQIASNERLARTIIDGYTGQQFGKRFATQEVFGSYSDAVWLTEPMLTITRMWENDNLVYDTTASPVLNSFGFPLEITQTGKVIRVVNSGWDVHYDNQVDPTILYYGRFRDGARYKFEGIIGWNYVPQDIKLAAILLTGDLMSNDSAWRAKYLTKVSMSETAFEMHPGAFNGTGNLIVDNILDQYRTVGIVVI